MPETLTYRVPKGLPPGTRMQHGVVVKTPEEYLVDRIRVTLGYLADESPRKQRWHELRGEVDGMLLALAAIQAGGSYFDGGETRRLEWAIRDRAQEASG